MNTAQWERFPRVTAFCVLEANVHCVTLGGARSVGLDERTTARVHRDGNHTD